MANFWTSRTAIITGVVITLLGALYIYESDTPISFTMPKSSSSADNGVPGLEMKLFQLSRNPPSLRVTLKNTNPDTPYTILKWGTPLDSAALNTGVFSITDDNSGNEVEQVVLMINRKMPPPKEELITVAPGTEEAIEVVFDKPWMPEAKPAKYRVKAEGEIKGAWGKYGDEVTEQELNAYLDSPFSGKSFATGGIIMEVH